MDVKLFQSTYQSVVDDLAADTGLNPLTFLCQFLHDSAAGESQLANFNNLAKIPYNEVTAGFGRDFSGFVAFDSLTTFKKCYTVLLSFQPYTSFRNTVGEPVEKQLTELGNSPWDSSHYGDPPGSSLIDLLPEFGEQPSQPSQPVLQSEQTPTFWWYPVESGDSLWKLAAKFFGDGTKWFEIFNLNMDRINDPANLPPGLELRIPGVKPS